MVPSQYLKTSKHREKRAFHTYWKRAQTRVWEDTNSIRYILPINIIQTVALIKKQTALIRQRIYFEKKKGKYHVLFKKLWWHHTWSLWVCIFPSICKEPTKFWSQCLGRAVSCPFWGKIQQEHNHSLKRKHKQTKQNTKPVAHSLKVINASFDSFSRVPLPSPLSKHCSQWNLNKGATQSKQIAEVMYIPRERNS